MHKDGKTDNGSIKKALNDFKGTCKTVINKGRNLQKGVSKSNLGSTKVKKFINPTTK